MKALSSENTAIIASIEHWVAQVVVRHRFCPFAKPAIDQQSVSYTVLDGASAEAVLEQMADQIQALLASGQVDATELLVLSAFAADFDEFLDTVALAEALIESMGWYEKVQIATFHPDYCFAETSPHSIENYTNRAPWPVLQLLQVNSVGRALEKVADPESIPQRNIEHIHAMDDETADQLMRDSVAPVSISGVPSH